MTAERPSVTSRGFRHLPRAGTAAHDLVRLLHDQLAPRFALALTGILTLSLVIAHVHELRVVVAVCFPKRQQVGTGRGAGEGLLRRCSCIDHRVSVV